MIKKRLDITFESDKSPFSSFSKFSFICFSCFDILFLCESTLIRNFRGSRSSIIVAAVSILRDDYELYSDRKLL